MEDRGFSSFKVPQLEKIVDKEILEAFEGSSVFYGDILNAQLIKEIRLLREALKRDELG